MTTVYTPARAFVQDNPEMTYERIARTIGCVNTHVARYLRGERPVTPVMRTKLVREFGAKGESLSDLCDETRKLRNAGIVSRDPSKFLKNTPAYIELARLGVSQDEFVERLGLHRRRSLCFLTGSLELSSEWRDFVLAEWGPSLLDAIVESHRVFYAEKHTSRVRVETSTKQAAYRGQMYTIAEWKAKFGEPGCSSRSDLHGRVEGVFPTEPCFLGE